MQNSSLAKLESGLHGVDEATGRGKLAFNRFDDPGGAVSVMERFVEEAIQSLCRKKPQAHIEK